VGDERGVAFGFFWLVVLVLFEGVGYVALLYVYLTGGWVG
jgi:hypothetical protein